MSAIDRDRQQPRGGGSRSPIHPTPGWAGWGTGSASPATDITGTRSGAVLGPGEFLPGSVTVTLPAARPDAYLRWVAFWREVEHRMLESPSLEDYATSVSVPFLRGEVAGFVSDVLARQLVDQATRAQGEGKDYVVPRVSGDRRLLTAAKWYI